MKPTVTRIFLIVLALAAQLLGQQQRSSEVVRIQYHKASAIQKLILPMVPSGSTFAVDDDLKVITLAGPPDVVEMLMKNIARLDTPPPNRSIALTVHLVLGTGDADASIPDDLSGVVKQLHALFPFKGYQVLDTNVQMSLDGKGGMLGGTIPGPPGEQPSRYEMRYQTASVVGEGKARQISISQLDFNSSFTYKMANGAAQASGASLRTDVVVKDGQKMVIGKSTLGPGKESLFVVLSARVVE